MLRCSRSGRVRCGVSLRIGFRLRWCRAGSVSIVLLADCDHLVSVLTAAEFADIEVELASPVITVGGGGTLDETLEFLLGAGIACALLDEAQPDARQRAVGTVGAALAQIYEPGRGVALGTGAWRSARLVRCEPEPRLEATDEIGCPVQSDVAKQRGGKAGLVALVADDHDASVILDQVGDVVLTGRVESPLQDVAVDDERAWKLAVSGALFDGADVDDQRAGAAFGFEFLGFDSVEAGTSECEDLFDRAHVAARIVHRGWVSYMRTATTAPEMAVSAATA